MGHTPNRDAPYNVKLYPSFGNQVAEPLDDEVPLRRVIGQCAIINVNGRDYARLKCDWRVWREPDRAYFQ